jgi:undecaprenyl-diphosphatase
LGAVELLRAAVLGVVQGLTEFLPVSSSGHLILVPWFFGWDDQGLAFDVGLHIGTLLALLLYFWREWRGMLTSAWRDARLRTPRTALAPQSRLFWLIVAGSVPTAIAGGLFNRQIEDHLREPWLIGVLLIVVGGVMLLADRLSRRKRALPDLNLRDALLIGTAQAIALLPGVSRSGATISMGLARHLDREAAARFAFLLGTPAFVGAALLESGDLLTGSAGGYGEMAIGLAASFVTGIAVIHFLLRFLRTRSLLTFVVYRWVLGVVTLVAVAL